MCAHAYELVLGNLDIHKAQQGSGNAFDIVVAYALKASPQGEVWGCNYTFNATEQNNKKPIAVVRDFAEYYPDEKAGTNLAAETAMGGLLDIGILVYCNGPEPATVIFTSFTDSLLVKNLTKRSYAKLLPGNGWAVLRGSVYIGTETTLLPNKKHGVESRGPRVLSVTGLADSVTFQPVPKRSAAKAQSKGDDTLDMDNAVDRIIFEYDWTPLNFDKIDRAMKDT